MTVLDEQLNIGADDWILALHQMLILILVIGRWMLPRGGISREQLSQLLLVFIGTGADIIEFVAETISDSNTSACSLNLHIVIWTVWAGSLLQFGLVLTAVGGRKSRIGFETGNEDATGNDKYMYLEPKPEVPETSQGNCRLFFGNVDVVGIIIILCLQDLPFLVSRCYFFFKSTIFK